MIHSNQASPIRAQCIDGVRLASFFDARPVATILINAEHVVTHFNKAFENLLAVNAADMIGPERDKVSGLALSRPCGIVQKHHGSIDVQTEVSQCTTFRVTLPINQPATRASDGASPT